MHAANVVRDLRTTLTMVYDIEAAAAKEVAQHEGEDLRQYLKTSSHSEDSQCRLIFATSSTGPRCWRSGRTAPSYNSATGEQSGLVALAGAAETGAAVAAAKCESGNVGTRVDSYALRQPLGVVAGITPFNFPVMAPMWMFPVALACALRPPSAIPRLR
jgi:Aldehyde dehydrogenase family